MAEQVFFAINIDTGKAITKFGELKANTKALVAELDRTKKGTKRFKELEIGINRNKQAITEFNRKLRGSGTLAQGVSKGMINAFTKVAASMAAIFGARAILRGLEDMVDVFSLFEKSLANVLTLLSEEDLKDFGGLLKEGSIKLMEKYGFVIEDVNKALFDTISASIPAGESIAFLDVASKLAIAGVTDLKVAVDGMTSILNAYNLETEEAERVASAFFTAQKFGKTTVKELSENIGLVAPIAKLADFSYQSLLSTFALFTKQGIKTTETSTAIRAIIKAIIAPADDAAKAFEELGISTGLTAVKEQGLINILKQVSKAVEEDSDKLTELIPNVRALTAAGALGTKQLEDYDEIFKAVNEDIGESSSLHRGLAKQMETATQKTARQTAEIRTLKIEIGEKLQPTIFALRKSILTWFKGWIDRIQGTRAELSLLGRDLSSVFGLFEKRAFTAIEMEHMFETFAVQSGKRVKDVVGGLMLENAAVILSAKTRTKYIDLLVKEGVTKKVSAQLIDHLLKKRKLELGLIKESGVATKKANEITRQSARDIIEASKKTTAERLEAGEKLRKSQEEVAEKTDDDTDSKKKALDAYEKLNERVKTLARQFLLQSLAGEDTTETVTELIQKTKELKDVNEALKDIFEDTTLSEEKLNEIRLKFFAEDKENQQAQLDLLAFTQEKRRELLIKAGIDEAEINKFFKAEKDVIDEEFSGKQRARDKKDAESAQKLLDLKLELALTFVQGIGSLLSQDEEQRKKYGAFLKALALGEIAINLARELSNIAATSSANLFNIITFGAAGAVQQSIQSAIAIVRAAFATASVLKQKFDKGAILKGASHPEGGIPFTIDRQPGFEAEGGEILLTKGVSADPVGRQMASDLNSAFGGKKFQQGAVFPSFPVPQSDGLTSQILNALQSIDMQPVVSVVEINTVQKKVKVIEDGAIL